MEARTFIETYLDYLDAFHYLETKLMDYRDWTIKDSSGIQYMNNGWRVGISFERDSNKPFEDATPYEVTLA